MDGGAPAPTGGGAGGTAYLGHCHNLRNRLKCPFRDGPKLGRFELWRQGGRDWGPSPRSDRYVRGEYRNDRGGDRRRRHSEDAQRPQEPPTTSGLEGTFKTVPFVLISAMNRAIAC
jgi:hypothetical protein